MDRTEEGLGEHLLIKLKTFYLKVRLSKQRLLVTTKKLHQCNGWDSKHFPAKHGNDYRIINGKD